VFAVPLAMRVQVAPPSTVRTIVPNVPTAIVVVESNAATARRTFPWAAVLPGPAGIGGGLRQTDAAASI
jgi:hypothetical protein